MGTKRIEPRYRLGGGRHLLRRIGRKGYTKSLSALYPSFIPFFFLAFFRLWLTLMVKKYFALAAHNLSQD